jgi:bile acid-coenzyme A ligase
VQPDDLVAGALPNGIEHRRTDLILRGGANIYPAEVEAVLIEYPAVRDAVVLGLPCEEYGARVHAIIQPVDELRLDEIDAFVRSRLAGYKCPETYERADTALRDDAGKVRRAVLRDERLGRLAGETELPATRSVSTGEN